MFGFYVPHGEEVVLEGSGDLVGNIMKMRCIVFGF
jgi:hypothetical protein